MGKLVEVDVLLPVLKQVERAACAFYDLMHGRERAAVVLVPENALAGICKEMGVPAIDEMSHLGIVVREVPMRPGFVYVMSSDTDKEFLVSVAVDLNDTEKADNYWMLFGLQTDYGIPSYGWPTTNGRQCFGIEAYDLEARDAFVEMAMKMGLFDTQYDEKYPTA